MHPPAFRLLLAERKAALPRFNIKAFWPFALSMPKTLRLVVVLSDKENGLFRQLSALYHCRSVHKYSLLAERHSSPNNPDGHIRLFYTLLDTSKRERDYFYAFAPVRPSLLSVPTSYFVICQLRSGDASHLKLPSVSIYKAYFNNTRKVLILNPTILGCSRISMAKGSDVGSARGVLRAPFTDD